MTTQTTEDFQSTLTLSASPQAVLAALTTLDGLAAWWSPVTGSPSVGGELTFSFGEHGSNRVRVDAAGPEEVRWTVLDAEPAPEWNGTTIVFGLEPVGSGCALHFRHQGLTPGLECWDDCFSGWTYYLGSLADHTDRGDGRPFSG